MKKCEFKCLNCNIGIYIYIYIMIRINKYTYMSYSDHRMSDYDINYT